jgi:hypothetical protein
MKFRMLLHRLYPTDFNSNFLRIQPYRPQPVDYNPTSLIGQLPSQALNLSQTPFGFDLNSIISGFNPLAFMSSSKSDFINDPSLFSPFAFNNLFPNFMDIFAPPIQNIGLENMPTIKPQPEPSESNTVKAQPVVFNSPLFKLFLKNRNNNVNNRIIKFPFNIFNRGVNTNQNPYTTWDTRDPKDIKIYAFGIARRDPYTGKMIW